MADTPDIAKIKRNIQKMLDQSAPEADIDAYVESEGVTLDQLKGGAPQPDESAWQKVPIPASMAAPGVPLADLNDENVYGPGISFLRSVGQGAMLGYGDEIGGVLKGTIPALVTGEDPEAAYRKVRDQYRLQSAREELKNPVATTAGNVTGQVATGAGATLLTGGTTLPAILAIGAGQGALTGLGESEATELDQMAWDTLKGGAWGAAGAAAGYGAGKIIEKLVNRGIAYTTIKKAMDGNFDELTAAMKAKGISAAEANDVIRDMLRTQATRNPTAATKAIPEAERRIAEVGKQTIDDVNKMVSPENAQQFIDRLADEARQVAGPGYDAAYANSILTQLPNEIAGSPAVREALDAAKEFAEFQGRQFDANALSIQDLDAMQRFLRLKSDKAFMGDALETMKGSGYSDARQTINAIAGEVSPELAATQGKYAAIKSVEDAVELGKKALDPSKEFVEVADEFARLTPEQQQGYLASVATRLRTMLQQRSPTANSAQALNKEAIIEKLKAIGFPEEAIDDIIKRGRDARGVLDALVGGSDTAKKLGAAEASRSALSKFAEQATGDISMVGITGQPIFWPLKLMARELGDAQNRAVARGLIEAAMDRSGQKLETILQRSPQVLSSPILRALGIGAGGSMSGN